MSRHFCMARQYDNRQGFWGLFAPTNKFKPVQTDLPTEGADEGEVELDIQLPDETILTQVNGWESRYKEYQLDIERKQNDNEDYYLGKQYSPAQMKSNRRPMIDNLIFESLETFLPIATRANPEPLVLADNSEQGIALADKVKKFLAYQADRQKLRILLKGATRHWSLYFLGVLKVGWNWDEDDIETLVIRPKNLILDPDATILPGGIYSGGYIGERKKFTAQTLIEMFPKQEQFIRETANNRLGTKITITEWWTPDYLFYTLNKQVLGKYHNPHWNYDGQEEVTNPDTGATETRDVTGTNHFATPRMPYVFLSIFNLGKHPHDDTGLISQNLANQDLINKRLRQIDKNADIMNNGLVLSGSAFTKEQAAEAGQVLSQGGVLFVPNGDVRSAYARDVAQPLPPDIFNQLQDTRNELRNIFGTSGSTAEGIKGEQTVRGKIITTQLDSSRIGGGVTEYIEQAADSIFNWWVQLAYVHYDSDHYAAVLGQSDGEQLTSLRNTDMNLKLTVSVKEGSLIPRDPLTQMNQAIDLATAGLLDPITLFTRMEFPNPQKSAEQLYLWLRNPAALFPDLAQSQPGQVPGQPGIPAGLAPTPGPQANASQAATLEGADNQPPTMQNISIPNA